MAEEKHVTTATHSGNAVGIEHNYNKDFRNREEHVDPNKPIKILAYEDPRDVYTEVFGNALADYNERMEKTRHPERKIDNYYNKMYADYIANKDNPKKKAVPPIREMIVGIYEEKDDKTREKKFELSEEEQIEMLTEYFEQWQKNNPNMVVVGCAIHLDEPDAGIHMQIDYIPVGHCSRGLSAQVNMKQALREEGYKDREHVNKKGETVSKRADALTQWNRANNDLLQSICEEHGLHVDHPQRDAKEAGKDAPEHQETQQYKDTMQKAEEDADKTRQQAEEDAKQIREQAEADAKQTRQQAEDEAKEVELIEKYYAESAEQYQKDIKQLAQELQEYTDLMAVMQTEIDKIKDNAEKQEQQKNMEKFRQKEREIREDKEKQRAQTHAERMDMLNSQIGGQIERIMTRRKQAEQQRQKQKEDEPTR